MKAMFLGGSNTWGASAREYTDSYAGLVTRYLKNRFPGAEIYNMGIGGTGSRLCSFMIEEHLQAVTPDLVFFEYSINDSYPAMKCADNVLRDTEMVIRTILTHAPRAKCVMLHFAKSDFMSCTEIHRTIGRHYGIDSLDLQTVMRTLTQEGKLWDTYFADPVHPNEKGHAVYAEHICAYLDTLPDRAILSAEPAVLPPRYMPEFYRSPKVVPAGSFLEGSDWKRTAYPDVKRCAAVQLSECYYCDTPGASVTFRFTGHTFGLYHLVRNDCGILRLTIDGDDYTLDCWNVTTGDFVDFLNVHNLPEGEHTVQITVSREKNPQSSGYVTAFAGFLID